jgi:hypothetical protein
MNRILPGIEHLETNHENNDTPGDLESGECDTEHPENNMAENAEYGDDNECCYHCPAGDFLLRPVIKILDHSKKDREIPDGIKHREKSHEYSDPV